jgi:hypothetical protein
MDAPAANAPRVAAGRHGYEAWFVTLNDAGRRGYWFRYTTHRGTSGDHAGLWAAVFDQDRPELNRMVKETYPITALQLERPFGLALAGAQLGLEGCSGKVGEVAWRLEWESLEAEPFSVAAPRWQWLGSTGNIGSQPWLRIRGSVSVLGEERRLEEAWGGQQHTWGASHALEWNWGYAADPWGWFDGATALVRSRLGRELRWTGVGGRLAGRRVELNTPWRALRAPVPISRDGWRAQIGELEFEVMPQSRGLVAVRYDDPPGGQRLCLHTENARLRLGLGSAAIESPAAFEWASTPGGQPGAEPPASPGP